MALSTFRDVAKGQPPTIDVDGQEGDSSNEPGDDRPAAAQLREPQPSTSSPPRSSQATDRSMNTPTYSSDADALDASTSLTARKTQVIDDDDSFWAGMDMDMGADRDGGKALQAPSKTKQNDASMDEEDWDLVRQMEEEIASAEAGARNALAADGSATVSAPAIPNGNAAAHDDGWDDMYVDD